jgi:citrate lyase subunit beta/citryl-CoA lyase
MLVSEAPLAVRSLLFAPADNPRKIERAAACGADLILIDLEDSVTEGNKQAARTTAASQLQSLPRQAQLWVRINPLDGPHALPDLAAIVAAQPDGIMLPKATPDDARKLDHYLSALETVKGLPVGGIRVLPIATETPAALFRFGDYAGTPRLAALTWGAEDLATALGASSNRDEQGEYDYPFQIARTLCLAGAAAAGVAAVETIYGDYRDAKGLLRVAEKARRAGFRGMMAIHPDQVAAINRVFSPSEAEIARAHAIVDLFAANPDAGALGLDGEMLDRPHLLRARAILARADS